VDELAGLAEVAREPEGVSVGELAVLDYAGRELLDELVVARELLGREDAEVAVMTARGGGGGGGRAGGKGAEHHEFAHARVGASRPDVTGHVSARAAYPGSE